MMKPALLANLYNPHEQTKQQLLEGFVVRDQTFRELYQSLRVPDTTELTSQHFLIEGQRGMGKTTLLLRLSYEIETDPALQQWLIPIVFKEEAYYGIRSLYAFWVSIAQELENKDHAFAGLARRMSISYEKRSKNDMVCYEMLQTALKSRAKKLILFIDNLGELLGNFSDQEYYRLYHILHGSHVMRIMGASTIALHAFTQNRNGFQAIFQAKQLTGLNKHETRDLLLQLAKSCNQTKVMERIIAEQPGRVESLRILTGGVIRTIVLLFEIFLEQKESHTLADLNTILDRVTPLYKSRMDELSPLQREVVHAMALHWEVITPEYLAEKTHLGAEDVVKILKELEYKFLIERIPPHGNYPVYRLKERFFNIWYLMRLSRGDGHAKVVWLARFLENWYNSTEISQRARKHLKAVKSGKYDTHAAFYLTEAFMKTGLLDQKIEQQMLRTKRKLLQNNETRLPPEASNMDKELFRQGEVYYQQEQYEQAIQRFQQITQKNEHIAFRIGYAYSQLGRYEFAISYLGEAARYGHVEALVLLGWISHYHLEAYSDARQYYLMAVEKGHTDAMLHLAHLYYYVLEEYHNAKKYYMLVLKAGQVRSKILRAKDISVQHVKTYLIKAIKGNISHPEQYDMQDFPGTKKHYLQALKQTVTEAMFQLGNLHTYALRNPAKAEKFYRMAAKTGHVKAIVALGEFYQGTLQNYKKAEVWFRMAAELDDVNALVNLGFLYHYELKQYDKAEEYYTLAAQRGNASAMNALSWMYFEQTREKEKSFFYAHQAIELEKNICTAHTTACICLWNNRPEEAFRLAEDFMYTPEAYETIEQDILFYLTLLMAKQHYRQLDVAARFLFRFCSFYSRFSAHFTRF